MGKVLIAFVFGANSFPVLKLRIILEFCRKIKKYKNKSTKFQAEVGCMTRQISNFAGCNSRYLSKYRWYVQV